MFYMEKKITTNDIEMRCTLSDVRIEQRDDSAVCRTISGYAAKFEAWSKPIMGWFREQIARDAFADCDMSDVVMCYNHNAESILARTSSGTLTLSTDEVGLRFSFESPNTTLGNDMVVLVRRGDIAKCSFKFTVDADEWRYADKDNGLEYDERTVLHISKLYDVSLVVYPAYPDTEASLRHLEERKTQWQRDHTTSAALDSASRERLTMQLKLKN